VPLRGSGARVLWVHPPWDVYGIAAAAAGREIAIVTGGPKPTSSYLYLLRSDGSVILVRRTTDTWSIHTPIFVRAPEAPSGPVLLYWVEHSDGEFDMSIDTPLLRVMETDGTMVREVRLPLMWGTAPLALAAYPGNTTSTLVAFRADNVPTRYQILRNADRTNRGTAPSPVVWGLLAYDR
jgi:hypothetical protein